MPANHFVLSTGMFKNLNKHHKGMASHKLDGSVNASETSPLLDEEDSQAESYRSLETLFGDGGVRTAKRRSGFRRNPCCTSSCLCCWLLCVVVCAAVLSQVYRAQMLSGIIWIWSRLPIWEIWIAIFVGVLLLIAFITLAIRVSRRIAINRLTRQLRERKRMAAGSGEDYIPQIEGMSAEKSRKFLTSSATEQLQMLQSRQVSAEALMRATAQRAIFCDQVLNCLTQGIYARAIESAKQADSTLRNRGHLLGPLHGLPISLKDCINVAGTDSTLGIGKNCYRPAGSDAPLVKILKHSGGIPFVKTNLMQILCGFESNNPIFGRVCNPHNPQRTAGGSSGGEAALIAAFGSPLGVGTDIGGSIRIPAHFCGIAGFKPTGRRVSKLGIGGGLGQEAVVDSVGPLARRVDDLVLFCRVLFECSAHLSSAHDPAIPPLPFNEKMFTEALHTAVAGDGQSAAPRKLRIGWYLSDGLGLLEPCSAVARAVGLAHDALLAAGHTLVRFQPPDAAEALELVLSLYGADGNATLAAVLKGDAVDESLKTQFRLAAAPMWLRAMLGAFVKGAMKEKVLGEIFQRTGSLTVPEYWERQRQRKEYAQKFFAKWKEAALDAVICPPMATFAWPHGLANKLPPLVGNYTMLYNMLDYPAGVVPVTFVTEGDVIRRRTPKSFIDKQLLKHESAPDAVGMPVGVQVVALPWQDEKCLAVMKLLEDAIRHSYSPQDKLWPLGQ